MPNELIDDYTQIILINVKNKALCYPRKADETFVSDHALNTIMDAPKCSI